MMRDGNKCSLIVDTQNMKVQPFVADVDLNVQNGQ